MAVATAQMVTVAREAKGWTQKDVADASGLSQGYISKVENGLLELAGDRLDRVAEVLGCPADLLTRRDSVRQIEVTCLHHRRRQSKMTVGAVKRIEAITHLTRLTVDALLRDVDFHPAHRMERRDIDHHPDPAATARKIRRDWDVPAGPAGDVLGLLERAGIVVVIRDLGTTTQDAVSVWPRSTSQPPLMLINAGFPGDRQRFTACHELAHLALHVFPGEDQEREANQFAAEFLTPADQIRPQLDGLKSHEFRRLMELKAQWGVSIGMLVQRAKDLGCISERQFKEFRIRLSRMGWNTSEPVEIPAEHPSLMTRAIEQRLEHGSGVGGDGTSDLERGIEQVAATALMTPASFVRHYYPPAARRLQRGDLADLGGLNVRVVK